jgi:hypothetical protein
MSSSLSTSESRSQWRAGGPEQLRALSSADRAKGSDVGFFRLASGEVGAVLGRPSMGKTALLRDIAVDTCLGRKANVVFCSAREPVQRIVSRDLDGSVPCVEVGASGLEQAVARAEHGPAIYVLGAPIDQIDRPARLCRFLLDHSAAGCGLLVLDGWSVYQDPPMPLAMVIDGMKCLPSPASELATVLRASDLESISEFARSSGISTLLGIRTQQNNRQAEGPRRDDLLDLQEPLERLTGMMLWLHRPEIYVPTAEWRAEDRNRTYVTGSGRQGLVVSDAWLLFDRATRSFRSAGGEREGGA